MAIRRKPVFRRGLFRQPLPSNHSLYDQLKLFVSVQLYSLKASFNRLWETPISSALTILVVAIALALPASFHALIINAKTPVDALETTSQVSFFLKPELNNEAARKLAERLKKRPDIGGIQLLTKEEGLRELTAYSGFADALSALTSNPLPAVIVIRPTQGDSSAVERLLLELKTLPEADHVQFDDEWLKKLRALLAIADRSVWAFSLLLGLGVLFIVGNTIRLELQNRQEEIAVSKILGATNHFIRRPFIHSGFWYGFLGAFLAWMLANILMLAVRGPANDLAALYGSPYRVSFLGIRSTWLLLSSAVLLGVLGAFIVVEHYLRASDPE